MFCFWCYAAHLQSLGKKTAPHQAFWGEVETGEGREHIRSWYVEVSRGVTGLRGQRAVVYPFLSSLKWNTIPPCLSKASKGKYQDEEERWAVATHDMGRWVEDRTLNCTRSVCVFIAAQWNPPLYWAKTKEPKCQLLGGKSRLVSAFKSKHRELIQEREGQAGLQAKTCTGTGGGTQGIQGQPVWDNMWGCVKCADSPWQSELMVFSLWLWS